MNAPPLLIAPPVFVPPAVLVPPPAPPAVFAPPLPVLPAPLALGAPAVSSLFCPLSHPLIARAIGIVRRPIVVGWRKERIVDRPFIAAFYRNFGSRPRLSRSGLRGLLARP